MLIDAKIVEKWWNGLDSDTKTKIGKYCIEAYAADDSNHAGDAWHCLFNSLNYMDHAALSLYYAGCEGWWDRLTSTHKVAYGESAAELYGGITLHDAKINDTAVVYWNYPFCCLVTSNRTAVKTYYTNHILTGNPPQSGATVLKDKQVEKPPAEGDLRDLIAMHAMKSIMLDNCEYTTYNTEHVALLAYEFANQMMTARALSPQENDELRNKIREEYRAKNKTT